MSIGFVHLSDIHFGQEKGGKLWVHDDVKERLIDDVRLVVEDLESGRAAGIIVTGDIAFGGREPEYKAAAAWLDEVAGAAGCAKYDIQVVPGNHDIDRDEITEATQIMLDRIAAEGEDALDRVLKKDEDRELLYRRFSAYRPFAQGYRCPLDTNAELAEERAVELAPGRSIRFIRLNSALICSRNDEEGKLLLGERQRVLPQRIGEELVLLSHHPVHWFQDSKDASLFIRNRARVFISGHEHNPSVKIETNEEGGDLMMLAAGATVPPNSDDTSTYCYNFIEFAWDTGADALSVHVRPRAWVDARKRFSTDEVRLGGQDPKFLLVCPNFRNAPQANARPAQEVVVNSAADTVFIPPHEGQDPETGEETVDNIYPLLLLHFFRDLSPAQRMSILVSLGALPPDWTGTLSESFERKAFDRLVREGRSDELRDALCGILQG